VDFGLAERVVVVTGGTAGIGLATAEQLASEYARVATISRRMDGPACAELHVQADLFRPEGARDAIREIERSLGRIDALVNNVGYAKIHALEELTDEAWELALRANLMSAIWTTSTALPAMLQRGNGAVVHVASTAGRRPSLKLPDYSVAKAALLAYSRQVAQTYAGTGVRSNAVLPGPTLTPAWTADDGLAAQQGDKDIVLASSESARPMGRFAKPDEIASAIVFLSSPASSHVTGAEWSVSGGSVV